MEKQMNLLFRVNPVSGVPIYRQLIDQVNRLVASGFLKPGDELPSIRQASTQLEINQMTVSKAYSLLETTGVLERHRGKRMMVAQRKEGEEKMTERLQLIRPALIEAVTQAHQLALPVDVVVDELKKLLEEKNESEE